MGNDEQKNSPMPPDPLSNFMFGERRSVDAREKPNEEINQGVSNRGREWLFGKRNASHLQKEESISSSNQHHLEHILQNIDYTKIMENVDTLMTSAQELKPLFKKVRPLIDTFLSKNN